MLARLAKFFAKPLIAAWLVEYALPKPYSHICGLNNGPLYMERWWLMPRWMLMRNPRTGVLEPKAWHRRAWKALAPLSIRVHHIHRPDEDRELHDHPFDYRTFILSGWYEEEDVFGRMHTRMPGDTVHARAQTFHRIASVAPSGVFTLFVCGRRRNDWGFLVEGRKVYWRTYLGLSAE